MPAPIRLALVDPSPLALSLLEKMLVGAPDIELVGTAPSARQALQLVESRRPQVLGIALSLPAPVALELTCEVMSRFPCAILALDALTPGATSGAALLGAGAVDIWVKPALLPAPDAPETRELLAKIARLARVPLVTRTRRAPTSETPPPVPIPVSTAARASRAIAIGASTGGPPVLLKLLSALPASYPFPLVCVQHISRGFLPEMVKWLDSQCSIGVQIAQSGEIARPGTAYFAPDDHHLEIDARGMLHLSPGQPIDGHRPSATALFDSLARSFGAQGVAVLLTGMGSDGATGLQAVAQAGGQTFAQDEASCVVFGMPCRAIELGAAQIIAPPQEIARRLQGLARPNP